MVYATAEERAGRDALVLSLLTAASGGLTEYELDRRLRVVLGRPNQGTRYGSGTGGTSLRRLEAAGLAWYRKEPHGSKWGFRRVWFPC